MCEENKKNIISVDFHLGMKFRCSVLIAPVKTESCDIILYILEFTESNDRNEQRRMRMFFSSLSNKSYFIISAKVREYSISPTSIFYLFSFFYHYSSIISSEYT